MHELLLCGFYVGREFLFDDYKGVCKAACLLLSFRPLVEVQGQIVIA